MIKILHIEIQSNLGGIESLLLNMLRELNHNDFHFDFVTTSNELSYEKRIDDLGGIVYKVNNIRTLIGYILGVRKIIKEGGYDIIHIHKNSLANIIPILIAKFYNQKIIVHAHNTRPKIDNKFVNIIHYLNRYVIKQINIHKLACSLNAATWMFDSIDNVKLFHNAINVSNYKRDENIRRLLRVQLGVEKKIVIGHVGGFIQQKNHRFLLNVFKVIKKEINNAKLVLIGDGEGRKSLENYAREISLEKDVLFLGMRSDVDELLNIMDYFIFPSKYEGLGMALIEAQINGIHCIASTGCPPEVKISNYCDLYDLVKGEQWWGDRIIQIIKRKKRIVKKINYKQYDMKSEIKYLERIYMEIVQ